VHRFVMSVFSVLICNRKADIVFSKYFDTFNNAMEILQWEKDLFVATSPDWKRSTVRQQIACVRNKFVVFQGIGELIFFLSGPNTEDETTFSDILTNLLTAFELILKKNFSEQNFLENYAKICLIVDEMMPFGALYHADKGWIDQFVVKAGGQFH